MGCQLALVLVIGAVWGGLFMGFNSLTSADPIPQTQDKPTATTTAALVDVPTPTPTPSLTDTPIPRPTATIEPTVVPDLSVTPTPTDAPPTPTNTSLPPTDTPLPVEESSSVSFANDVFPIFERRCLKCHGGDRMENNFSVQSYETVIKGSWNGVVVEPGDVEGSYLIELIVSGEMPNKGPRLLPAEIEAITSWIEAGAPDN